jgi:hypothetical protein
MSKNQIFAQNDVYVNCLTLIHNISRLLSDHLEGDFCLLFISPQKVKQGVEFRILLEKAFFFVDNE